MFLCLHPRKRSGSLGEFQGGGLMNTSYIRHAGAPGKYSRLKCFDGFDFLELPFGKNQASFAVIHPCSTYRCLQMGLRKFRGIPPFKHIVRTRPLDKTRTLSTPSSPLLFGHPSITNSDLLLPGLDDRIAYRPTIYSNVYLSADGCAALRRGYKSKLGTTWIPSCAHHPTSNFVPVT